jgi:putative membrane protein
MRFLLEILITGLAVFIAAYILPGVHVEGLGSAVIVGILLAIVNVTIGLILRILTFPLNILTLGLVSFIISVLMVMLVDSLMEGFQVNGFLWAAVFAILLSVIKMIFGSFKKS